LQERFVKVTRERGDALVRIEDLEHVNIQLQNECDTIGEYITLYHNQRKVLQQRHHEKDQYISSMAQEREAMQRKVEKLQTLVMNLINSGNNKVSTSEVGSVSKDSSSSIGDISGLLSPDAMDTTPSPATEEETIEDSESERMTHGNKPDILPDNARMPSLATQQHHHSSTHSSRSDVSQTSSLASSAAGKRVAPPGKLEKIEPISQASTNNDKATANEIIALLEQMQGPSTVAVDPRQIPHGFCMRYMGNYNVI